MRSRLLLLGAAAILCPAAAGAQPTPAESRLIAAFTTICLEHMGDAAAQRVTAAAAPWTFVTDGAPLDNGLVPYRSGSTRLGIGEALQACTLTGEMEPTVTLASFLSALTAAVGTDEGQPLDANSRYWLIAGNRDEEQVLSLKVSNETGRNLATLWVQRRAPASQRSH
ncbi:MAG TPA: hypothetical protein VEC11_11820 [Allosphingosinicella sp.]|nr:hypothetical protein [Allosphingosinicella sp.]